MKRPCIGAKKKGRALKKWLKAELEKLILHDLLFQVRL